MHIFLYDNTFEGLLTCIFQAYKQKRRPDQLLPHDAILPLFTEQVNTIHTQQEEANRVWQHVQQKISPKAAYNLFAAWLSEEDHAPMLLFHVICKIVDAPVPKTAQYSLENDLADPDTLALLQLAQKVGKSRLHVIQFVRFQKTKDGVYFAPINPIHNTLPLALGYFKDRFADQPWIIYDVPRNYGYYYTPSGTGKAQDSSITEITLDDEHFAHGQLKKDLLAADERLLQTAWAKYFKALTIKERLNPKLHRQHMPARFWKYLPEKNASIIN